MALTWVTPIRRRCQPSAILPGARLPLRGAELEIVLLDHPSLEWGELESRIHDLLESLSQEQGFDYRSTGPLLESCRRCLLPGDGHLSGEGARRVAAFLASPGAVGP